MKTTKQVLVEARDLISKSERWTQQAAARRQDGLAIHPLSPKACSWCSYGAVWKAVGPERDLEDAVDLLDSAARDVAARHGHEMRRFIPDVVEINDRTNHAMVMEMFTLAIERCKE